MSVDFDVRGRDFFPGRSVIVDDGLRIMEFWQEMMV